MEQYKIDLFKLFIDNPYFYKEYILGKFFNLSISDINYLKTLEIKNKRDKKIDDLLNDN